MTWRSGGRARDVRKCSMVDRRDGRDAQLQRLGFGCVKLGGSAGMRAGVRLVRAAIDSGVTVFDTADAYNAGASERTLGHALGARRADVVVMTKGGYLFRDRTPI